MYLKTRDKRTIEDNNTSTVIFKGKVSMSLVSHTFDCYGITMEQSIDGRLTFFSAKATYMLVTLVSLDQKQIHIDGQHFSEM